jgi:hypothetical protein
MWPWLIISAALILYLLTPIERDRFKARYKYLDSVAPAQPQATDNPSAAPVFPPGRPAGNTPHVDSGG